MSNVLKEWHPLNVDNDRLELVKSHNSFSSSYFDEPDTLKKFVAYCRDFFKKDIKIKISGKTLDEKVKSQENEPSNSVDSDDAELPSHVQNVLHVFQGKIIRR